MYTKLTHNGGVSHVCVPSYLYKNQRKIVRIAHSDCSSTVSSYGVGTVTAALCSAQARLCTHSCKIDIICIELIILFIHQLLSVGVDSTYHHSTLHTFIHWLIHPSFLFCIEYESYVALAHSALPAHSALIVHIYSESQQNKQTAIESSAS